jgi:4a-hydroxytetrahydrobiopterin dehydratase
MKLSTKSCVPCEKGTPALADAAVTALLGEVVGWTATKAAPGKPRQLEKRFEFDDFLGSMAFLNRVAAIAEAEQHHPDFSVHYNKVDLSVWTHTVGGLSENDFILAAKIDGVFS